MPSAAVAVSPLCQAFIDWYSRSRNAAGRSGEGDRRCGDGIGSPRLPNPAGRGRPFRRRPPPGRRALMSSRTPAGTPQSAARASSRRLQPGIRLRPVDVRRNRQRACRPAGQQGVLEVVRRAEHGARRRAGAHSYRVAPGRPSATPAARARAGSSAALRGCRSTPQACRNARSRACRCRSAARAPAHPARAHDDGVAVDDVRDAPGQRRRRARLWRNANTATRSRPQAVSGSTNPMCRA